MSAINVIVVGAGPAGSLTAYHLAKAGARVVLLDAMRFPREKPCGGGVQSRALEHIPFDVTPVLRGHMDELALSFGFHRKFFRRYPDALVHAVLRAEFDAFLLQEAANAGALVRDGVRVASVCDNGRSVTVATERETLVADYVVGADGANSVVRKLLNERDQYFWQTALYCEVPEEEISMDSCRNRTMRVDWGSLPSGYAWIFPKRGSVNIGVGCPSVVGRALRPYLDRFLASERAIRPNARTRLRFRGHQLPTLSRQTRLQLGRMLLVGDAAGLVDPFTGEGISNACLSAKIASSALLGGLENPTASASYECRVRAEILPELLLSRRLLRLAMMFPTVLYKIFERDEKVWEIFCEVVRGENSFQAFFTRIFGPAQFLLAPFHHVFQWLEQGKLARFAATLDASSAL